MEPTWGGEGRRLEALPAVAVRSIRPDDDVALRAFHSRLSDDTIRNRFFGAHPTLGAAEARRFTDLDPGTAAALVATTGVDIVGVGRYVRVGTAPVAEVAFVIEDGFQGHGLGTELLTLISRIAWGDGIRRFVADTFAVNRAMLDVFFNTPQAVTVASTRRDGSVTHLVMTLTPPPGITHA